MNVHTKQRARLDLEHLEPRDLPTVTTLTVAEALTHGPEFSTVTVKSLYQQFLKRDPAASEITGWAQSLNAGYAIEQLEAGFLVSNEYLQAHGGAGQDWLQSIYQDLLNRTPSQTEIDGWLSYLHEGHNPGQVALGFTTSMENVQDRITGDYTLYLGRMPGPSEVAAWTQHYVAGMRDPDMAAQFINSWEDFNLVSQGDYRTWLINGYQDALQRAPGESEIAYWMAQLGFTSPRPPATVPLQTPPGGSSGGGSQPPTRSSGPIVPVTPPTSPPPPSPASTPVVTNTFTAPAGQVSWTIADFSAQPFVSGQVLLTPPGGAGNTGTVLPPTYIFSLDIDLQQDGTFTDPGDRNWFRTNLQAGLNQGLTMNMPGPGLWVVRPGLTDPQGNESFGATVTINVAYQDIGPGGGPTNPLGGGGGGGGGNAPSAPGGGNAPSFPGGSGGSGGGGSGSGGSPGPAAFDMINPMPNVPLNVSGALTTSAPTHTYTFTLAQNTGLFISLISRETGLSTTLDSNLTLLNSGGTQIDSNDNGYDFVTGWPAPAQQASSSTGDSDMYDDLSAGTYTVNVGSVGGTLGKYVLRLDAETNYSATVPVLNSKPGAKATIYLDFSGYSATDDWGTYTMPPYHINSGTGNIFSPGDQLAITNMWRIASEDFSPFNINITTSYSGSYNDQQAMRCVITNSDASNLNLPSQVLGVALLTSFSNGGATDKVCFVFHTNFAPFADFNGGTSGDIEAVSHEVANDIAHEDGHTFGLVHYDDITVNGAEPFMESPHFDLHRGLWWKGMTKHDEPPVINQDDMAIISDSTNGFGYQAKTVGSTIATATALTASGTTYATTGIIAHLTDTDVYSFQTGASGVVTVNVTVDPYLNCFNSKLVLVDGAGNVLGSDNNPASFNSTVTATLPAGTYYVEISSKGGNGEAGQYAVAITVPALPPPPPPPGGGGTGGGSGGSGGTGGAGGTGLIVNLGDIGNAYNNSDKALQLGTFNPGTVTYEGMSIKDLAGIDEQDFYRWTMADSGALTVSLAYPGSNGVLQFYAYQVNGDNSLSEIGAGISYNGSAQSATMNVSGGQNIIVYVFGFNFATGAYQMTLSLT